MFKVDGFDKFQKELKQAQLAVREVQGELGTVQFDAQDPVSIETAISTVNEMLDERLGKFSSNPLVGAMLDQLKEGYREGILERAASARLSAEAGE